MADSSQDQVGRPQGRRRWWVRPLLAGAGVGLLVAVIVVLLAHRGHPEADRAHVDAALGSELAWAPGERPAPDFSLPDQRGDTVRLASLRGRPVLLAFLNTLCANICPIQGRQLSDLARVLPEQRRPIVLAVSVNPGDTPATARRAAADWDWSDLRWHWLLGSRDQLAQVWRNYGILAKPADEQNQVEHTGALFLIDANGDVRSAYTVPIAMPRLLTDIESVQR
jgi:cytochrome oxidase Cu insertion factor (SCO1/SenC/PrrC family)